MMPCKHLIAPLVLLSTTASAFATPAPEPYLDEVLTRPAYARAWNTLLAGERSVDAWLARYARTRRGPVMPGKRVEIGGASYRLNQVCKTHACGDNRFFVLFSEDGSQAWGMLLEDGTRKRFFGQPDAAKRALLEAAIRD